MEEIFRKGIEIPPGNTPESYSYQHSYFHHKRIMHNMQKNKVSSLNERQYSNKDNETLSVQYPQ